MGEQDRNDAELVEAYCAGDEEAFAALVHRYVRLAGSVAYQVLGDYQRAADATQDAFLKAHGALHGLREPARFRVWFYGVVRTVALDHLRRRRRGPASFGDGDAHEQLAAVSVDPAAGLAAEEQHEAVRAALQQLPESYREVVVLKYLDDRSYKEIAELLDTTPEAVESRLTRARAMLRGKLRGFARRSGLL